MPAYNFLACILLSQYFYSTCAILVVSPACSHSMKRLPMDHVRLHTNRSRGAQLVCVCCTHIRCTVAHLCIAYIDKFFVFVFVRIEYHGMFIIYQLALDKCERQHGLVVGHLLMVQKVPGLKCGSRQVTGKLSLFTQQQMGS